MAIDDSIEHGDRRADIRVRLDIPVATMRDGTPRRYRLIDLSCGGAQLERDGLAPPPHIHTMVLYFGAGRSLRLLARTVWSTDTRYAVCFLALDDFDRLTIAERIDELLTQLRQQEHVAGSLEPDDGDSL